MRNPGYTTDPSALRQDDICLAGETHPSRATIRDNADPSLPLVTQDDTAEEWGDLLGDTILLSKMILPRGWCTCVRPIAV